jgi:uncharacterized protein
MKNPRHNAVLKTPKTRWAATTNPSMMSIYPSRHNIISPIPDSDQYLILNILSGNADFISITELELLKNPAQCPELEELKTRGYIVDPQEEQQRYQLKYNEFLEERIKEEVQIFFVPTYACNFSCSYCYQSEYPDRGMSFRPEITVSFFHFVERQFKHQKKYITLFGGEPLLPSPTHKSQVAYFIEKLRDNGLELSVVTNGFSLDKYFDLLDSCFIREIQVTLDGTSEVHNMRRQLKNSSPTFERIVENIDQCLARNLRVNLRMVIDRDNLENLPMLASFAIDKGWTSNPLFKTQIGRNYELHYCQSNSKKLLDRLTLYQELYTLIQRFPHIMHFHKPAFSVMSFLHENGKLPNAIFDACPACKSEWAMDYSGNIYPCTATVGKPGEKVGTFFPEIHLDTAKISPWQKRDVTIIEKCIDCNVQLICGGGCGSLASNKNKNIHSPDCRPIAELTALGAAAYFMH